MHERQAPRLANRPRTWRSPTTELAILAIALTTGITFSVGCGRNSIDCGSFRFDADAWAADNARAKQARFLEMCNVLEGMTSAEVREMLGAPGRGPGSTRRRWLYVVGLVRGGPGFGDDRVLQVRFDDAGRVISSRLVVGG